MNKRILLALLMVNAVLSLPAATPKFLDATAADNFKAHWVPKATTPVVIDGALDEEAWQAVEPLSDWGTTSYGRQTTAEGITPGKIDFRVIWDDQNLYCAIRAYHDLHPNDMEEFRRQVQDTTKAIYSRECIEIHIDGNLDHATRFQSILNPLGEKMMIWHYDFGWGILENVDYGLDADWDAAGRVEKDHWTLEVRYALSDIQVQPRVGYQFGINPCWFNWADSHSAEGKKYWWQFVTWSTHNDSHHDPRLYGRFILVDEKPKSLEDGLRLAFPDLASRSVMIQTADGLEVFKNGQGTQVSFADMLTTEVDEAQAALATFEKVVNSTSRTATSHFGKQQLPACRKELSAVSDELAAGLPNRAAVARLRKAVAAVRGKIDEATWRAKEHVLLSNLPPLQ